MSLQFNFVGRILGPRGLTAKQLEAETGCKIMVRGKGSMRDKKKVSFCFSFSCLLFRSYFIICIRLKCHMDAYACRYRISVYAWLMHVKCKFRQFISNGIFYWNLLSCTTIEQRLFVCLQGCLTWW